MARDGTKTGGRKKGSKNQRTHALDKAAKNGKLPLDYMLEVMRDPEADCDRALLERLWGNKKRSPLGGPLRNRRERRL